MRWRGGSKWAWLAGALFACGGGERATPGPTAPIVSYAATPSTSATPFVVHGPADDARALLVQAAAATDPSEQCRLVHGATLADPTFVDARRSYAATRCAAAKDLLVDAQFVFEKQPDAASAALVVTVATRASMPEEALAAAEWIEANAPKDLERLRLAAATAAKFDAHAEAGRRYGLIADARLAHGSAIDAIDAYLDASMEVARAGVPNIAKEILVTALAAASKLDGDYGEAWIGPKMVEAIAVLRAKGDPSGAAELEKRARAEKKIFGTKALRDLDLEHAIAEARATKKRAPLAAFVEAAKKPSHLGEASGRAVLAIDAKLDERCGDVRAYVHGQGAILESVAGDANGHGAIPSFDEDVQWALQGCLETTPTRSLARPFAQPDVTDASAVAAVDRATGRLLLHALVDRRPHDAAARIALADASSPDEARTLLDAGLADDPFAIAFHLARYALLVDGKARGAEIAELKKAILPKAIEVRDDPRAAAPIYVRLADASGDDAQARLDLGEAILQSCAAPSPAGKCLPDRPDLLAKIARALRGARSASLATLGPALSDADLANPLLRLDVVEALLAAKKSARAEEIAGAKHGKWEGEESAAARAMILASAQKCDAAKMSLAQFQKLAADYPDEVAFVGARCK